MAVSDRGCAREILAVLTPARTHHAHGAQNHHRSLPMAKLQRPLSLKNDTRKKQPAERRFLQFLRRFPVNKACEFAYNIHIK